MPERGGPGAAEEEGAGPEIDEPGRPKPPSRRGPPERRSSRPLRFPGWTLIILGGAAGGFAAGWWGLAFGAVVGFLIWRTRR